jgi:hypothetical protein
VEGKEGTRLPLALEAVLGMKSVLLFPECSVVKVSWMRESDEIREGLV